MLPQFKNIETQLIALGKKIVYNALESIVKEGDICNYIIYLPEKTQIKVNNSKVETQEGLYLNVKEFFSHETFKSTITALQLTNAIMIDQSLLKKTDITDHQINLFFLMKLSQHEIFSKSKFE